MNRLLRYAAFAGGAACATLGLSGCANLASNPTYRSVMGQTTLGGSQNGTPDGPDILYLTSEASTAPKDMVSAATPLLPLQVGNHWDMQTKVQNKPGEETIVVVGPAANAWGQSGIGVETQRNGKRFRYEIYQSNAVGLFLLAAQDETSTLMSYSPPVPLVRYPAKEGSTFLWRGQMRMGKDTYPANALSRFSSQEDSTTLAGKFHAFRLDSMISVSRAGQDIRFPGVRWLAPNIGFVRRGYAEKNAAAFAEVIKFNIR